MIPRQQQHFNGAWLAAFSFPANNHLWGNQCPGLGGHTDSLPGPLAPIARASFPLHEDSTPPSPTLEAVLWPSAACCGRVLWSCRLRRMAGPMLPPPGRARVPAKATEEQTKCTSRRLNPMLCFRGYKLTSGLSRSPGPQAH